jgi:hypothetical protein
MPRRDGRFRRVKAAAERIEKLIEHGGAAHLSTLSRSVATQTFSLADRTVQSECATLA